MDTTTTHKPTTDAEMMAGALAALEGADSYHEPWHDTSFRTWIAAAWVLLAAHDDDPIAVTEAVFRIAFAGYTPEARVAGLGLLALWRELEARTPSRRTRRTDACEMTYLTERFELDDARGPEAFVALCARDHFCVDGSRAERARAFATVCDHFCSSIEPDEVPTGVRFVAELVRPHLVDFGAFERASFAREQDEDAAAE